MIRTISRPHLMFAVVCLVRGATKAGSLAFVSPIIAAARQK
jgi:hypothetical protein